MQPIARQTGWMGRFAGFSFVFGRYIEYLDIYRYLTRSRLLINRFDYFVVTRAAAKISCNRHFLFHLHLGWLFPQTISLQTSQIRCAITALPRALLINAD